jgi:hypothetical protein
MMLEQIIDANLGCPGPAAEPAAKRRRRAELRDIAWQAEHGLDGDAEALDRTVAGIVRDLAGGRIDIIPAEE